MNKVYIHSAVRLSGEEPDYKPYIPPMQARRMGVLLKRALVGARMALSQAALPMPDAILCGTSLGCMEPTERILAALQSAGEEGISPTDFMQSTHNTIASTIAIHLGCRGYNCTYSQGAVSFENALLDAFLLLAEGEAQTALVCENDERTPDGPAAWQSVSVVLSTRPEGALCELEGVQVFHGKAFAPERPEVPRCPLSGAAGLCEAVEQLASGQPGPLLVWTLPAPDGASVLLK